MTPAERPILFSAPMVRAIRNDQKTQTRRVVKYPAVEGMNGWHPIPLGFEYRPGGSARPVCPYGVIGDRLWVRETWFDGSLHADFGPILYRADGGELEAPFKWTPSIHMPRWASRFTLEITDRRIERLQDISEEDAIAEGVMRVGNRWEVPGIVATPISAVDAYKSLWEYINGRDSWAANPWLWAITFRGPLF